MKKRRGDASQYRGELHRWAGHPSPFAGCEVTEQFWPSLEPLDWLTQNQISKFRDPITQKGVRSCRPLYRGACLDRRGRALPQDRIEDTSRCLQLSVCPFHQIFSQLGWIFLGRYSYVFPVHHHPVGHESSSLSLHFQSCTEFSLLPSF